MNDSTEAASGAEWEDEVGSWPGAPVFAMGALVGALVLGLAWLTTTMIDDDPARSSVGTPTSRAGLVQDQGRMPVARGTRMQRCALAEDRLTVPLGAAAPAMAQWEVHVGAMNQLVVGAITLQQATDFWNDTRVAARRKIGHFEDAVRSLRRSGLDCPVVERLGHASKSLRACAARVDAHTRAVDAAETAIRTWERHVDDMDMMRMGHLSPAEATEAWLASWQQGVREIEAYEGAARTARRAGSC